MSGHARLHFAIGAVVLLGAHAVAAQPGGDDATATCELVERIPFVADERLSRQLSAACAGEWDDESHPREALTFALNAEADSANVVLNVADWAGLGDTPEVTPELKAIEGCVKRCATDCNLGKPGSRTSCATLRNFDLATRAERSLIVFRPGAGRAVDVVTEDDDGEPVYYRLSAATKKEPHVAVAVPRNRPYRFRFIRKGVALRTHRGVAWQHAFHRGSASKIRCLNVAVDFDAGSGSQGQLLLDGRVLSGTRIDDRITATANATLGRHALTITAGSRTITEVIEVEHGAEAAPRCQTVAYSLKSDPNVALVAARAGDQCKEFGFDDDKLRTAAEWYLRSRLDATSFRNNDRIARFIRTLRDRRPKARNRARVASKGRYDTARILDSAEDELARRGVTDALFIHLSCAGSVTTPVFTVEATRFELSPQDDLSTSEDASEVRPKLRPESETVNRHNELRAAVAGAIDRTLGMPYVRWADDGRKFIRMVDLPMRYEAYGVAVKDVRLRVRRMRNAAGVQSCRELRNEQRLRAHRRIGTEIPKYDKAAWDTEAKDFEVSSSSFGLRRAKPGLYLVEAIAPDPAWDDPDRQFRHERAEWARRCVQIVRPEFMVGADGTYGSATGWGTDQHSRFRASLRLLATNPVIDVGLFAGASVTTYRLDQPRAWDGTTFRNPALAANGQQPLEWEKKSILAGIEWDVHLPMKQPWPSFNVMALQPYFAPGLAMSISYVDASRIPGGVGAFDAADGSGEGLFDLDVDFSLRLGLRVLIGPQIHFDVAYPLGILSLDDLIVAGIRGGVVESSVVNDPAFIWAGIHFGAGWAF
jgi:hypothetical protein